MQRLADLGALHAGVRRVCEIGPGSGRYLARTIERCAPEHYEIYETSDAWREWLLNAYDVIALDGGRRSLRATPEASIDLAKAHKVFSWIAPVMSLGD